MTRAGKLAPSRRDTKGAMDAIRRTGNTRNQWLAAVMAVLTAAFFLRVAGQAIQRWMPQPWLPPFAEWQGSTTPYPLLVATQSVILVLMLATAIRVARGKQARRPRAARWWWWAGGIYMAASIARIVFGLLVPDRRIGSRPASRSPSIWCGRVRARGRVASLHGGHAMRRVLPYAWYPISFAVALAAFFTLLARRVNPALAAYIPAIGVGFAVLFIEMRFAERDDWRPKRDDMMADAAFMALVMMALPRLLAVLVIVGLGAHMRGNFVFGWWPHDWPLWAQMAAMVLAVDFVRYGCTGPAMPCCSGGCTKCIIRPTAVRHERRALSSAGKSAALVLDTVPFLLLGVAPTVMAGYFLLYSVNGFFQHSNLLLRHGWLNYVVGSAETHRWHHAADPAMAPCNFSNTTIVWDLVFGTWYLPKGKHIERVGLADENYPKSFLAQMAAPFRRQGAPRSH